MKQRIITALIIAPLAIAGVFLLPLSFFMFFWGAVFLLAGYEWGRFVDKTKPLHTVYLFLALLVLTVFLQPAGQLWENGAASPFLLGCLILAAFWWCLSLLIVLSYPKTAYLWATNKVCKNVMGMMTLIPFFWGAVALRSVNIDSDFYFGGRLLLLVFLLVWAADTGAYFCGKNFGKRKLAANVSPGKTVEGFIGGLISAMLVAYLASFIFSVSEDKQLLFLLAALLTTCVSALGDLNESIFKREAGLKDSGNILPGHGGILDRIDSLTAAVPVFALIYLNWLN